jgi:hypothetical protein
MPAERYPAGGNFAIGLRDRLIGGTREETPGGDRTADPAHAVTRKCALCR